jgi:hypothetical protein
MMRSTGAKARFLHRFSAFVFFNSGNFGDFGNSGESGNSILTLSAFALWTWPNVLRVAVHQGN